MKKFTRWQIGWQRILDTPSAIFVVFGIWLQIPAFAFLALVHEAKLKVTWEPWSIAVLIVGVYLVGATSKVIGWIARVWISRWKEGGRSVAYITDQDVDWRSFVFPACAVVLVPLVYLSAVRPQDGTKLLALPIAAVAAALCDLALRVLRIGFGATVKLVKSEEWYFATRGLQSKAQASLGSAGEGKSVVRPARARYNFDAVDGMLPLKRKLVEAGAPVVRPQVHGFTGRNGILLTGDPGNGKTYFAEALAGELNVGFVALDYGMVVSQWVGETPSNIRRAFEQARAVAPCVLFIDEIDSFIVSRDDGHSATAEAANIVNVMLTELVNIRDSGVLVVAATNRLAKLDTAAIREGRFDFKIEVPSPDEAARIALLTNSLRKHVTTPFDTDAVVVAARRWNGFSVKRIMAVGEQMPTYLRQSPAERIGYDQLMGALRAVQGRKGTVPTGSKKFDQLVLPAITREAVDMVAHRLKDAVRIERLGGTLPTGVLLHGPSGTGKTAVARAMAIESGWAFLAVAGPDLLKDHTAFEKVYQEAKDLRPCLIFIDEADAVLRDRSYSQASSITDKMLSVLDGAGDKVRDVVVMAATNNPDQVDAAMQRRFTEKIPFFVADEHSVRRLVAEWVEAKAVLFATEVSTDVVATMLEGLSPAVVESVLQYALNAAIHSATGDKVLIERQHLDRALTIVAAA